MSTPAAGPEIPCVGAVVLAAEGRLLLIRRGNPPAQGLWSIPGGRVEDGESDEAAVLRELREEAGVAGSIVREVGTVRRESPSGGTYVIRDFLVTLDDDPLSVVAGGDATDVGWYSRAQLDELECSPGLVEALGAWGVLPR